MLSFKQYKQQKQLTESVEINPIKDLEEVILNAHPEVEKLHLYPSGKHDIKLDTLIVKKEHRKQGVGSKVLHDLKTYADKHGKRIILTANVRDSAWGTTSQSRLDKFYKRNGFVANKGRNKDYAITATHYYAGKGHISESVDHPMIEVDGEMKHRHNSLGQPIHPTDEGIRNFHRWFGDSQAVDDHGRPIVLYHGTNQDFDTFDFSKARESGHVWASNDPKVASNFAIYRTVWNDANVMPVYVNAKRIKSIDAGYRNIRDVDSVIHDAKRDMDYDAFVVKNARDSVNPYGTDPIADVWAIKDTSNIKSAIGNSGNFSSTSNKITESEDYMGSHTAPTEEDAPAHDLTKVMPEDVYSPDASRYYSTGFSDSEDRNVFAKLHSIRNNPAAMLTIYRAIPKSETRDSAITKLERHKAGILKTGRFPAGVDTSKFKNPSEYYDWAYDEVNRLKELPAEENIKKTINKGDWVTLSRAYAKEHGDAHLGGQYRILSKSVRADEVFTNGDSIHEWGYHPKQ